MTGADDTVSLTLRRKPVVRCLAGSAAAFVALSVLGNVLAYGLGVRTFGQLRQMFQLDSESSFPTWFATLLLLLAAGLFAVVGGREHRLGRPWVRHWNGLAVIFVALSALEATTFREKVLNRARDVLPGGESELLRAAWIVPVLAALFLVGIAYVRFFGHLPSRLRRGMVQAAVLFLSGAVLVEVLGNLRGAQDDLLYFLGTDLEEALEMAGVIFLVGVLIDHLSGTVVALRLVEGDARQGPLDSCGGSEDHRHGAGRRTAGASRGS